MYEPEKKGGLRIQLFTVEEFNAAQTHWRPEWDKDYDYDVCGIIGKNGKIEITSNRSGHSAASLNKMIKSFSSWEDDEYNGDRRLLLG